MRKLKRRQIRNTNNKNSIQSQLNYSFSTKQSVKLKDIYKKRGFHTKYFRNKR